MEPMLKVAEREPVRGKQQAVDPLQWFQAAQVEFIEAAGRFGLDPDAKRRVAEARQKMRSAAEQISKDAGLMSQGRGRSHR